MATEEEIEEFMTYIGGVSIFPTNLRLFLIEKTHYLRFYKGHLQISFHRKGDIINSVECNRGSILEIFSKIEFLMNEMIQTEILPEFDSKKDLLDDVLEGVSLHRKLNILNKWGVLDNTLKGKLDLLRGVRNGFAHLWGLSEIKYQGKPLESNFPQFKTDLGVVWDGLVSIWKEKQKDFDLASINKTLKDLNKKEQS